MNDVETTEWLEKVTEEHRELRRMLGDVRGFLDKPRPPAGAPGAHSWASDLANFLVKLHDSLFRHFRYEEQSGMAEDLSLSHPRISPEVDRLLGEHPEILKQLRALTAEVLDYSEGNAADDPALRTRLGAVLDRLDEHERAETRMIHRAALQEVGIGD